MRLETCYYCSSTIWPGHGIQFVRNDCKVNDPFRCAPLPDETEFTYRSFAFVDPVAIEHSRRNGIHVNHAGPRRIENSPAKIWLRMQRSTSRNAVTNRSNTTENYGTIRVKKHWKTSLCSPKECFRWFLVKAMGRIEEIRTKRERHHIMKR